MTSRQRSLWYVRRAQVVRGPYPPGQIVREVVLGRIRPDDELSHDREQWQPLSALPEFQAETVYQTQTPEGKRKLARARLHEDERQHDRRGSRQAAGSERRRADRRKKEPDDVVRHRQKQAHRRQDKPADMNKRLAYTLLAGVVLALAIYLIGYHPAPATGERNCRAAAAPGVNWSGCLLSGQLLTRVDLHGAHMDNSQLRRALLQGSNLTRADLRYADLEGALLDQTILREADLTGAVLRGTILSRADLRDADLRFANLVNANLDRALLAGARLDKAIWTDGRICAPHSLGSCQ